MLLDNFHPKQGHYLKCDFSKGFQKPEAVKVRPIVVISNTDAHGNSRKLATVVVLSTTPPSPVCAWHHKLSYNPNTIDGSLECWAKCDMIYTVSYNRLDRYYKSTNNGRNYLDLKITAEDLNAILKCIQIYLGRESIPKQANKETKPSNPIG
jgi:uncharacterized protein YifN (PemK superfamily)